MALVRNALLIALALAAPASALAGPSATDAAFVAKVSQGGMFEVEAGKLAEKAAEAQNVKNFAVMEVHDHKLVGAALKTAASHAGIKFSKSLNAEFQGKISALKALKGPAFDAAYMDSMADIHAKDGAAFAQEAEATSDAGFKAFASQTHLIVQRHIGAIQAVPSE